MSEDDDLPVRFLIVGVDAGSPILFERWMKAGDMPNLSRLKSEGAWATVRNPAGLEAGAVWPVFHSALLPGHQPQYDGRRYFDASSYSTRWYTHTQTPPTFWKQFSDRGLRCLLIDPPYVHLDESINGAMVVDWGGHVPADGQQFRFRTHPAEVAQEILELVGSDPAEGVSCDKRAPESIEDYRAFIARYRERIEKKGDLVVHMLGKGSWNFALTAFMDLHCTGHHLWHINDRTHPMYRPELEEALGEPLRDCYRLFDQVLGRILQCTDDETNVMLLGSHGMGPQYTGTGVLDRILLALDVGKPAARSRSLKGELRALWHLVPVNVRAWMKPLRKPFQGRLHPPRFLGDEPNRRFFEVYANNASGGIRINLQGREAQGKVPCEEYDRVASYLKKELEKIVNVDSGEALVEDVFVTSEYYDGEYLDRLPDLLVRWNRRHPIRAVRSDAIGTVQQETVDSRTGDHTPEGIFYVRGPAVQQQGRLPDVKIEDIPPTLASFFGVELTRTDGSTIEGLLASRDGM